MTPQQIIDTMKHGNERFRMGVRKQRNYLREQRPARPDNIPPRCC